VARGGAAIARFAGIAAIVRRLALLAPLAVTQALLQRTAVRRTAPLAGRRSILLRAAAAVLAAGGATFAGVVVSAAGAVAEFGTALLQSFAQPLQSLLRRVEASLQFGPRRGAVARSAIASATVALLSGQHGEEESEDQQQVLHGFTSRGVGRPRQRHRCSGSHCARECRARCAPPPRWHRFQRRLAASA
jgi:hypothetical protein